MSLLHINMIKDRDMCIYHGSFLWVFVIKLNLQEITEHQMSASIVKIHVGAMEFQASIELLIPVAI